MSAETEQLIAASVEAAEEVDDTFDELVGRSQTDPSAPYKAETLAALAELRRTDRGAFEALRVRLKAAGVRMAALENALRTASGGSSSDLAP